MVQSTEKVAHVVTAMFAVMKALAAEGIGKSRRNQEQKFNFRGVDDVMNVFGPLLVENNLIVLPRVIEHSFQLVPRGEDKAPSGRSLVKMELTFESAIDGSTRIVGPFVGEGGDVADKSTGKASSYAFKEALLKTFSVPVEGSPEDRDPDFTQAGENADEKSARKPAPRAERKETATPSREQVEPETVAEALERLVKNGDLRDKLKGKILEAYGVMLLEDIPDDKVQEAIQQAETFVKRQAARKGSNKAAK